MPANKKPKKKYKPFRATSSAIQSNKQRKANTTLVLPEHVASAEESARTSFEAFRTGTPTTMDAIRLLELSMLSYVIDNKYFPLSSGYGQYAAGLMEAVYAMWTVFDRYQAGKPYRFTSQEMQAVGLVIDVHVEQLKLLTYQEMQESLIKTRDDLFNKNFFRNYHATNARNQVPKSEILHP